jgi:PhzF family phenazine biosynthesis protein
MSGSSVPLTWVDAFADRRFAGNPAGVCLLNGPLPDATMQAVAAELGIAETAFVTPSGAPGTFDLRWFSPLVEIDLCGHATLASAHVLRADGVIDGATPVTFDTRSGALRAAFAGDRIELDFPADSMVEAPLPEALAGEWDAGAVLEAGSTPFFGVVVLGEEAAVRQYQPDLGAIAATGHKALLVTAAADAGSGADYVVRVFGPNVGIDEDPATGSAQCVAGPYWAAVLGRRHMVAHQLSPRGAVLHVRPDGDRVHIGGNAITVFRGELCLG